MPETDLVFTTTLVFYTKDYCAHYTETKAEAQILGILPEITRVDGERERNRADLRFEIMSAFLYKHSFFMINGL